MEKTIPSFKVILWDINRNKVEYYDIMPYLINCWNEEKNRKYKIWNLSSPNDDTRMPKTVDEFKKFVKEHSMHNFWSRCEYEIIISDWPCQQHEQKIDAYDQIKANIDVITEIFMKYVKK